MPDYSIIRICPNPKGNPKCLRIIAYRDAYLKADAERNKRVCHSCKRFGFIHSSATKEKMKRAGLARYGVDPADVVRICPNPNGNPGCKKMIVYESTGRKRRAEKGGGVCKSCMRYGFIASEESRERMRSAHQGTNRGADNPFYGRRHTEESKRKMGEASSKRRFSEESRRKMGDSHRGKKRSVETIRKMVAAKSTPEFKAKISARFSGAGNPMYGKPTPFGKSFSIGGWFNGRHFRSSCELRFLLAHQDVDWQPAESNEFRIEYIDDKGQKRHYFPDFFWNDFLIEIRPHGWKRCPAYSGHVEKTLAAIRFCRKRGWEYVLAEVPSLAKERVFGLRRLGLIELDRNWERRFQEWNNDTKTGG